MAVDSKACQAPASQMPDANNGLIAINLSDLEAETRCPVCLGVIKNARLVSGCMHRFCAECIEKWLRVCRENNCPQCRMPMQSRRDCKKDGKYDRLLRLLYDDIEKYETEMLDADDAILEQAMQTGAALKKARDLQKAARKPRVDYPQTTGHAAGQQGSLQQPYGVEHKGPYRSIPVGPAQWVTPVSFAHSHEEYLVAIGLQPTKPLSDLKAEMQEGTSDQLQHHAEAAAAGAPMTHVAEEVSAHAASSLGQFDQRQYDKGQYESSSQNQLQRQSQAQRWLTLQHTPHEPISGVKPEPVAERMGDVSTSSKQKVQQQSHGHPRLPLGSPGKIVPLASLHHHPGPSHQALAPRAAPIGMPSMPVGSTTGIIGRSWPGQPQYGSSQAPVSRPGTSAGSGPGESRGTKRAGGDGGSKSKKRQRHGDRERSVENDQNSGRQSTGPITAFLRPLPPAQPEAEAKAMAASLAATAAANAQQQKHAVHAVVQVCVKPEQKAGEGRALPKLQRPFLMCPVDMQIGQLQKHVTDELKLAGQQNVSGFEFKMASGVSNPATQGVLPQQTLRELASLQHGMQQHLVSTASKFMTSV
ncbi:TPA: hypothetical protein ACH3X1_004396 [Trebouxia sp. C0004]